MSSYDGIKVEYVQYSENDIITVSNCLKIVANTVLEGTQVCSNPTDTTVYMIFGPGADD